MCQGSAQVQDIYLIDDSCSLQPFDVTALNIFDLQGRAMDQVLVVEFEPDSWYVIQVQHHKQTILSDINYNSQKCWIDSLTLIDAAVMTCREASRETTLRLYPHELVTDFSTTQPTDSNGSTCKISANTKVFCLFEDGAQPGAVLTVASFEAYSVLKDFYVSPDKANCIDGTFQLLYVLCAENEADLEILCGTDCNTSGSGSQ
jgi:hypothetical protein